MQSRFDRVLSVVLTIAAVAIAVVLVRREFLGSSEVPAVVTPVVSIEERWSDIVRQARKVGPNNAPVVLIEFADFECPACRRFNETLQALRSEYPNDLQVGFVHFPLRSHRFARPAARGAECAGDQHRFFEYHDVLYAAQDSFGLVTWAEMAQDAGVPDVEAFEKCVAMNGPVELIESGRALGEELNVPATPTIFINAMRFSSPPSITQLRQVMDSILAASGS